MDRPGVPLEKECCFRNKRGVALLTAFTLSLMLLGLIASFYWIITQRYVLQRKRAEHTRGLYLTEAGMNDAIARLRIGNPPAMGIDPAAGRWYCLDVETATITRDIGAACAVLCANPGEDVRVCVSSNIATGRNQIDVTANF